MCVAFLDDKKRTNSIPSALNADDPRASLAENWNPDDYYLQGDPYGLLPIYPNISSLPGKKPYLESNEITAFSILDTGTGKIDSYYFDTTDPESEVVHFDSFSFNRQ